MTEFETKARELGLSQTAAQGLVDFYSKLAQESATAAFTAYQETRAGWTKEIIADPAIGNGKDGLNTETKAAIGRVKDALGPELQAQLEDAMDFTGAGDNPAVVRALVKIAERMTEGRPVVAGGPSKPDQKAPTAAQAMWPGLPSSAS